MPRVCALSAVHPVHRISVKVICNALIFNRKSRVNTLNLGNNKIVQAGFHLSKLIRQNKTLRHLYLWRNNMGNRTRGGESSFSYIGEAIPFNRWEARCALQGHSPTLRGDTVGTRPPTIPTPPTQSELERGMPQPPSPPLLSFACPDTSLGAVAVFPGAPAAPSWKELGPTYIARVTQWRPSMF